MAYKTKFKRPKVLKVLPYQIGTRASVKLDKKRKALPSGKRESKTGNVYWETRRNRTDMKGNSWD